MERPIRSRSALLIYSLVLFFASAVFTYGEDNCGCSLYDTGIPWTARTGVPFEVEVDIIPGTPPCSSYTIYWQPESSATAQVMPASFSWSYDSPGRKYWWIGVTDETGMGIRCSRSGYVDVSDPSCSITCSASVPAGGVPNVPVTVSAAATLSGCTSGPNYFWDFGDGGSATGQSASHTYTSEGEYTVKVTVSGSEGVTCTDSDSITISPPSCPEPTPYLEFCADQMEETSPGAWSLSGNVRVNDILHFSGPTTVVWNDTMETGSVYTTGGIYVKAARGDTYLLSGSKGVRLDFDGLGDDFSIPGSAGQPLDIQFQGVPFYLKDDSLLFIYSNSIRLGGYMYVGDPQEEPSARLTTTVRIEKGGSIDLSDTSVGSDSLLENAARISSDGVSFFGLLYDDGGDTLQSNLGVNFPFLNDETYVAEIDVKGGCINSMIVPEGNPDFPLKKTYFSLRDWDSEIHHICDPVEFGVDFSGRLSLPPSIPSEFFQFSSLAPSDQTLFEYRWPWKLKVFADEMTFCGYPLTFMHGRVDAFDSRIRATASGPIEDLLDGIFRLEFIFHPGGQTAWYTGSFEGRVTIPADPCGQGADPNCADTRALLEVAAGLPYTKSDAALWVTGRNFTDPGLVSWFGSVWGRIHIMGLLPLEFGGEFIWTNVAPPFFRIGETFKRINPAKTAEFTAGQQRFDLSEEAHGAYFAVEGTSAMPAMSLQRPGGETITPENAVDQGAFYVEYSDKSRAFFHLKTAEAGGWILMESALPPGEAEFSLVVTEPPPDITFTSVETSGESVEILVAVDPAEAGTAVSLFYSTLTDGTVDGLIEADLPADAGSVSATWDISAVPSGKYYLLAEAEYENGRRARKVHEIPVAVDTGGLSPPTGLTGVRTGETASLSWSLSPSPSVVGYSVLYTDDPENPGYPEEIPALGDDQTTVKDLDSQKDYRFAVQAYGDQGNLSLESDPWDAPAAPVLPGDCDGTGAVSIGEVQKVIRMHLRLDPAGCGVDCEGNGQVSIGELQKAINAHLRLPSSCGVAVTVSPSSVTLAVGESRHFTAAVAGASNSSVTWSVQEGASGGTITQSGFYTAPQTAGIFHVVATSVADPSRSAKATVTVEEGGCTLTCSASADPSTGEAPLEVQFAGSASGCPGTAAYSWSFGDGGSSSQQSPSHTYDTAGAYGWTLNVAAGGESCTRSGTVTVTGQCTVTCSAVAEPASGDAPLTASFTASATGCGGTLMYLWDFGDGSNSTQQNTTHTYDTEGTYLWHLSAVEGAEVCTQDGAVTVSPGGGGTALTLGVPLNDSLTGVNPGDAWNFYYVDVPAGPQNIVVEVTGLTGDVDLYLRIGDKPNQQEYTCRSWNSFLDPETCTVTNFGPFRLWVGVMNFGSGTMSYTVLASSGKISR